MANINWTQIERLEKQRHTIHEEVDASYSIFEKMAANIFKLIPMEAPIELLQTR